ncbi:MAG: hypothetical protein EOO52_02840 [Gammaproteobacteria bacterium]|nr:MAG: hypothetical protein EOO52_02840 [Gammaproteobacteria bacterium]
MELPNTNERVAINTSEKVNNDIQMYIQNSIYFYRRNPQLIEQRLDELDKEWDIERVLETNASSLIVASSALGFIASKKFFFIPFVVGTFLLQHALQGWCPPLPILRRLGYRTTSEIQEEREALQNIIKGIRHVTRN